MIQALQWFNKLSLLLRQRRPCQPVDWGPAFPIAHLWTRPLREKADLTSGFTGLCVWSVQFLYTDKWIGLFSSVWGWTRPQSCWDETKGGWSAPSPLHPSYLCIGLLPSLKSLQTPLFLFHHHSFPHPSTSLFSLPLSSLHCTLQIYRLLPLPVVGFQALSPSSSFLNEVTPTLAELTWGQMR